MKRLLHYIFIFAGSSLLYGQVYTSKTLDFNDVKLEVASTGLMFHDHSVGAPSYEVPKGSGNHVIFAGAFWFGGVNQLGDTLISVKQYRTALGFFSGPVSSSNHYNSPDYLEAYDEAIWKVSKAEIEYHIDNYDQAGYEAPVGIKKWPANGSMALGVANDLAPYIDVNEDGVYNPQDGDYPCIQGDEALYMILNDMRPNSLPSQATNQGMGLEIHIMLYQFNASNYIDQTTFIKMSVFNRGENSFTNFKPTLYLDPDVGFTYDDYIGSDTTNNVGYAYNATEFDYGGSGASGYGNTPPAVGVVCLNHKMDYFGTYLNSGGPNGDPETDHEYWNYMNGKWKDGTPWVYGGTGYPGTTGATTTPTNYFYTGNPLTQDGWSEVNTDGNGFTNPNNEDRRFLLTSESQSFVPEQVVEYEYAIIFNKTGSHLENAVNIVGLAEAVNTYYMDHIFQQSCKQEGTGVPDDFTPQADSIVTNQMFEITRLDGIGNMGLNQKITASTESDILASNRVKKVHYERGYGPIMAYIYDTLNHETGYFQLKFNSFNNNTDIDSAFWTVYRYDTIGGTLLDSVESSNTITGGGLHYISQWGIAIKVKQHPYICSAFVNECHERSKYAPYITSSLTFENPSNNWLTGVKDNTSITPLNWTYKMEFTSTDSIIDLYSPACYFQSNIDPAAENTNSMAGGIIAPSKYTRINKCGFLPLQNSGDYLSGINYSVIAAVANNWATVYHPGVDIVFTPDQSKWTRCPVLELNSDPQTAVGNAIPGMLRQSPSVDKNGNPDNSGTIGMSWFPGYAIDVETGRRLNMAFCENSTLSADNGADMIWNPSERLFDNMGNYVLGGQHAIYVFGGEFDGMPDYDEGTFLYNNLSTVSSAGLYAVYRNLSWVMQPLLNDGHTLLESEARVSVRHSKAFKTYEVSGLNNSKPMFEWNAVPYESLSPLTIDVTNNIHVFPNPTNKKVTVTWDEKNVKSIALVNTQGQLEKHFEIENDQQQFTFDVSQLTQGLYIVKAGNKTAKIVVH